MAVETISGIPSSFGAGDTLLFTENFASFPSTAWTAILTLNINGKATSFPATGSGTGFLFTISAADSAKLGPGQYDYVIHVTETATSQRTTAKAGFIRVLWDLSAPTNQTTAQAILAAIETAILKLSSGTNSSVNFNGQSFTKKDLKSLTDARAYWKQEVLREQGALRGTQGNSRIGIRFASPYSQFPVPTSTSTQ